MRTDVLLAVVVLLVVAPIMQPLMAQQGARYALTAAIWDAGTVEVTDYEWFVTVDRAERDGRLYSDKAPGQPVLAVPAYALHRTFGGTPAAAADPLADLGLWWVNLVSSALPAAALAVLMRRFAMRVAPRGATPAALVMALSTMLLPFGTLLFGHVLSALLGIGAYLLLTRGGRDARPTPAWVLAASGLLAGLAVAVEFTMGLAVVVFGIASLVANRWRTGWYVLGGVLPAVALAAYNLAAFGSPLTFSYEFSEFAIHGEGFLGAQFPDPGMTWTVLFGERGLFLLTPVVLVGVVGCLFLLRGTGAGDRQAGSRRDALVTLALLAAFVGLMGGWNNPTGGASPGPRYVLPAVPFCVIGVAWVWERASQWVVAAAVLGAATMGIATFTLPLAQQPYFEPLALRYWFERAAEGAWAPTLLTQATGGGAWLLLVPLLAAAGVATWLFWPRWPDSENLQR